MRVPMFNDYFEMIQRKGKEELHQHLKDGGYFSAPASTQYHLSSTGGLLAHSINVTHLMLDMFHNTSIYKQFGDKSFAEVEESIATVGLFHDLGKANYYGKPNYVPNVLKNGKQSDSKPYEKNKELLNIPHEVSSIHILSQFIALTEEETFAILYHNGLYTSTGYNLKGNEQPLQQLLHMADMWCSRFIEK